MVTVVACAERLRSFSLPLIEATYPDSSIRLVDLDSLVAGAGKAPRLSDIAADFALEPPRLTSDLAGHPSIDEDWLTISQFTRPRASNGGPFTSERY